MNSPFSKRTEGWSPELNPLSVKLTQLRAGGKKILDLTVSNPTLCGFSLPDLSALSHPKNHLYEPDARGLLEARQAVCRYYQDFHKIHVEETQVFITANTSEAYSFVFRLLADPGDTILAPRPSYPLLHYLAGLHDLRLIHEAGSQPPRAILLVNPNNPTGKYARVPKAGLPLIVDEVFLDYSFAGNPESFAGRQDSLCFTLSGISKILGLPQMKISWIIVSGPENLKKEALHRLEIIADTYLSASAPSQHALPKWLEQTGKIQTEIKTRLKTNLETAKRIFARSKARLIEPEGGWYTTLEMPESRTDEEWALRLLETAGTLTHPGYLFDFEEEKFLVLSLLGLPEEFEEGCRRITAECF